MSFFALSPHFDRYKAVMTVQEWPKSVEMPPAPNCVTKDYFASRGFASGIY